MQIYEITFEVPQQLQDPHEVSRGITETVSCKVLANTAQNAVRCARNWVRKDLDIDANTSLVMQSQSVQVHSNMKGK